MLPRMVTLAALCGVIAAGGGNGAPPNPTYQHYIAGQRGYLAVVKRSANLAGDIAPAEAIVASMPPDAIGRIDALGIPLLVAADDERRNRSQWTTVGTDWTRYALPDSCCRTPDRSKARLRASARKRCAETAFQTVDGAVARTGRATQRGIPNAVGIVPIGVDEYRGVLLASTGTRLPVVWQRQWVGQRGDPLASDPIDTHRHRFSLRRLVGARYWSIAAWSGADRANAWTDRAGCVAALTPAGA